MAEPVEVVTYSLSVLTGLLYAYVGLRLGRRHVEGEAGLAWGLFVHFWYGLGGLTLMAAAIPLLQEVGVDDAALYMTLLHALLIAIVYALWALLYYLVYLFTGNRSLLWPLAGFYALYYVFLVYVIVSGGYHYDAAERAFVYETEPSDAVKASLGMVLVVPIIAGAIGYFRLYFAAREPTQRWRIGLVAGSIGIWFASSLIGYLPAGTDTISQQDWWRITRGLIGLAAAATVLAAYLPPRWVRDRYKVVPVDERPRGAKS